MKDFFDKVITGINNYFKSFWTNTKQYFKINLVALIIIAVTLISLILFLSPKEKVIQNNINATNNAIANNYDKSTDSFTDLKKVDKLQSESESFEGDIFIVKLIKFLIISLIIITITGPLANLLMWSYTKINFGHPTVPNNPVLVTILVITFLIEYFVYQSIFVSLIK